MKTKLKALIAAVSAIAVAASCAACSFGGRSSEDDIPELTERSGSLRIWWPGSSLEMTAINQAVADYTALYPDVEINVIGQSTADFYQAYTLACSGNSAPDIAYIDHVYLQSLAHYHYIANLSSAGFEELEATFADTLWSPGFYNEKLYALPMSANVLATVYNKTLIARAQNTTVDNIALPKNFDELVALSEKIVALNTSADVNDPYYAITLPSGTGNDSMAAMTYLAYLGRCGGSGLLSDDLTKSNIASNASKDAAKKLYTLGKYAPQTFSEAKFEEGKIGFIEMGPWKIKDYEKYSTEHGWEVGYTTAIPMTEGGNIGSTIGMYQLVVTNNQSDKNKMALAADFAKFVATDDKYQLAFATPQNLIPTTKSAMANEFYSSDVWQVFIDQLDHVVVRPGTPAWSDIESTLGSFVTKLVQRKPSGEAGVEQECEAISEQVQEALDEVADM